MAIFDKKPSRLERRHLENLSDYVDHSDTSLIGEIINTLDGNGRCYILEKMADRFARSIETGKNEQGEEIRFKARTDYAKKEAIKAGFFEVVSPEVMQKIVNELATIWTEGVKYAYDGGEATFAEDLAYERELANSDLVSTRVDQLSVVSGSAAQLVQVIGGAYNYQSIRRDRIWVAFADTIIDNEEERATIQNKIEEATAVVIQLGVDTDGKGKFAAWFGRSDENTLGRFVQYTANEFHDIPAVGEENARDYMINDFDHANPLTIWNDVDYESPEYPIYCWYGSDNGTDSTLLPISTGLYEQHKEFDVAASRIALSMLKSARGITFLGKSTENAADLVQEVIDEGPVEGGMGQTLTSAGTPASNSVGAWEILQQMINGVASSYGVPAYAMATDNIQFPSGVALAIANEPLVRAREKRININRSNAARKFKIEMALASAERGKVIAPGVTEIWTPSERTWPSSEKEYVETATAKISAGLSSIDEQIMVMNNLESMEAVQNWKEEKHIEALKQPTTGIAGRLRGGNV